MEFSLVAIVGITILITQFLNVRKNVRLNKFSAALVRLSAALIVPAHELRIQR
jgi:hypothetical protein